jgi:hypothetical protein
MQEVVEEDPLALHRFRVVVIGPLLAAVDVEPLLRRGDSPEALQRATGMQAVIGPARHHEGRDGDLLQVSAF